MKGKSIVKAILLTAMVLGIMPGMGLNATADNELTVTVFIPPESWNGSTEVMRETDFPGFQASTAEAASAWTGAPKSGWSHLIYDTDPQGCVAIPFEYGAPHTPFLFEEKGFIYDACINMGSALYYTCSPAASDAEAALDRTEASLAESGAAKTLTSAVDKGISGNAISLLIAVAFAAGVAYIVKKHH